MSIAVCAANDPVGLWAQYVRPGAKLPAGSEVVLIENVPIVRAAEGYGRPLAALASVLDYAFPSQTRGVVYDRAPILDVAVLKHCIQALGPKATRQEKRRLMHSFTRGAIREKIKPLMALPCYT